VLSLGLIGGMAYVALINDDKETVKYKKEHTYYYLAGLVESEKEMNEILKD